MLCCFRRPTPPASNQGIALRSEGCVGETKSEAPHQKGTSQCSSTSGAFASDDDRLHSIVSKACTIVEKLSGHSCHRGAPTVGLQGALNLVTAESKARRSSIVIWCEQAKQVLEACVVGKGEANSVFSLRARDQEGPQPFSLFSASHKTYAWTQTGSQQLPNQPFFQDAVQDGCTHMLAAPIPDSDGIIGVWTLSFNSDKADLRSIPLWGPCLQILAASLTSLAQDTYFSSILQTIAMLKGTLPSPLVPTLEPNMVPTVDHLATILLGQLHQILAAPSTPKPPASSTPNPSVSGSTTRQTVSSSCLSAAIHFWFKMVLISEDKDVGTVLEDVGQVPNPISRVRSGSSNCSDVPDEPGTIVRSVVFLSSTIARLAVSSMKPVTVYDVQRLLNQCTEVSSDVFTTHSTRPPVSILAIPVMSKGATFGVLLCLSPIATDFSEVARRIMDASHLLSKPLAEALECAPDYSTIQNAQVMPRRSLSYTSSLNGFANTSNGINISNPALSPSRPGSRPGSRRLGQLNGRPHVRRSFSHPNIGTATFKGQSAPHLQLPRGPHESEGGNSQPSTPTRMHSPTAALVAGLTDKLNRKKLEAGLAMDIEQSITLLSKLQLVSVVGKGGFAWVFQGRWQGRSVAVKVVVEQDTSEGGSQRQGFKHAHEIALLMSLSHPNIVQAFTCLTDVAVEDLLACCFDMSEQPEQDQAGKASTEESASPAPPTSPASPTPPTTTPPAPSGSGPTYMRAPAELKAAASCNCHVQVLQFCDRGTLAGIIQSRSLMELPQRVGPGGTRSLIDAYRRPEPPKALLRHQLVVLLELGGALAYLHGLGVVHCDLKPANILLQGCTADPRGFTVKLADFGLSRVEDDGSSSAFLVNSCGTAMYMAPEGLVANNQVGRALDVYAFGIIMWELFTGKVPFAGLSVQDMAVQVCQKGLRPAFPAQTPSGYRRLAESCWAHYPEQRPRFAAITHQLTNMLTQIEFGDLPEVVPCAYESHEPRVAYISTIPPSRQQEGRGSPLSRRGPHMITTR